MYTDALTAAAEQHAGPDLMARIDTAAAHLGHHLTDAQAWPVLRRHLALLAIEGHDPIEALHQAAPHPARRRPRPRRRPGLAPPSPHRLQRRRPRTAALAARHPRRHSPPTRPGRPTCSSAPNSSRELADHIRGTARAWDTATAPAWARPLLDGNRNLLAEIAVFRAAHNVEAADTRITGPEQHANRSAIVQQAIHSRLDAALTRAGADTARWRQLADTVDPHLTDDPFWPRLATHLDDAARAGADVAALLHDAAADHGPLPAEMPAAALWWRLAGTLAPPSLEGTDTKLRPPWTADLHHLLGTRIAEAVITDPAWPGLVAAVTAADWPPHDLLAAAAEHLHDIAATQTIRPDEYARLLTYRVELLTHHAATIDPDIPHPAEHAETPTGQQQFDLDDHSIPDLDLHEPPPDPYDYPYGFVEDDLAGLDIDDLPTVRPAAPARVDDIDIPALRARRDAAHHHAHQLADAILTGGGGPAEHAAAAELAELHRRLLEQRPYQQALAQRPRPLGPRRRHRRTAPPTTHPTRRRHHRGHRARRARRRRPLPANTTPRSANKPTGSTPRCAPPATASRLPAPNSSTPPAAWPASSPNTTCTPAAPKPCAPTPKPSTPPAADARDLDDQLARAEAAAARSLAQSPAHTYDLGADLDQLQAEVDFLHAASAASPAAMYTPPPAALAGLDDEHRRTVSALTTNIHSVQLLHLHPGADKTATLAALADTAHHHNKHIVALTGTDSAADRAYADTTATIDTYRDDLTAKRHTPPLGSLVIVDDAQALTPGPAALARPQRRRHQHQTRAHRHRRPAARPHPARRPHQRPAQHPTPGHPRPRPPPAPHRHRPRRTPPGRHQRTQPRPKPRRPTTAPTQPSACASARHRHHRKTIGRHRRTRPRPRPPTKTAATASSSNRTGEVHLPVRGPYCAALARGR